MADPIHTTDDTNSLNTTANHAAPDTPPTAPLLARTSVDGQALTETDPHREADDRAQAMGANLRQDVAAWAATRDGGSARANAERDLRLDPAPAKRAVSRARKAAAPVVEAATPKAVKKPFSMSYSGVTTAQHIQSMLARGAR